jgi:hypothetical protein
MNQSARTTARESGFLPDTHRQPFSIALSAWRLELTDVEYARSVDGKRYFETGPLRASFVRPDKVTVGDFPELDPFADEDEDDEMEM